MLQKGFLKSRDDEKIIRAARRNRTFLFVGMFVILFSLIYMMTHAIQHEDFIIGISLTIAGFILVSVSLWMNFFSQKKNRHKRL